MRNILTIQNKKFLDSLPNHTDGEIAFCEDENLYFVYKDNNWIQVSAERSNTDLKLRLYDLNKQLISQLDAMDAVSLQKASEIINNWAKHKMYMLYGQEINYFTLLAENTTENNEFKDLGNAIITLLQNMTDCIYSIDAISNESIEIWIKYQDSPVVLYLFNYEDGLVLYG